jgi:carbamoyl-phosphate synthase large subunit
VKKVFIEASGSMVSAFMIEAIKSAGYRCVASDISEDTVGKYLADEFIQVPSVSDPNLWDKKIKLLKHNKIDVIFPSLDESLTGWAKRENDLRSLGIHVIVSSIETIEVFSDKWKTYCFFKDHGIPTPQTSLSQDYPLVKPINGRGAVGVRLEKNSIPMEGLVSQEVLYGIEYTVDVLCDFQGQPIYIVPRLRKGVIAGKSTKGQIQRHERIETLVRQICEKVEFRGPINLQCFELDNGEIKFIEINPRVAGGMALSFAATENWVEIIIKYFLENVSYQSKPIQNGKCMYRYYKEVYI